MAAILGDGGLARGSFSNFDMGSASSRNARRDKRASRPKRRVVSERDAWKIALAWRDELQGCVRLETSPEELSSSIIPVFEWIVFVFNGTLEQGFLPITDPAKAAAYARAATIAWFALSCCEGYGGRKNPEFWKRVFLELLFPKGLPARSQRSTDPIRPQIPITDGVRFFTNPDRYFPRIKLAIGEYDGDATIENVFLGHIRHEDMERDAKLRRILTTLEPFIDMRDVMRRVPVAVDFSTPRIVKRVTDRRNLPSRRDTETNAVVSVAALMDFPPLELRSVVLLDTEALSRSIIRSIRPPSGVEICVAGNTWDFMDNHRLCPELLNQLWSGSSHSHEEHSNWRLTWLCLDQFMDHSFSHLNVVCSSLPHLQSIRTARLDAGRYSCRTPTSTAPDWAWLGYAIFHPDASEHSGLTSLEVGIVGITRSYIVALAKMARGNNLLGDANAGYLEGRVRCGAELKKDPAYEERATLHTFAAETWVGICLPSTDTVSYQDWACVVVPGFGSGWIRGQDIIETRCRRPGVSCIRVLHVEGTSEETTLDTLTGLLSVLGDRLTSLFFHSYTDVSASVVHAILSLCPNLKTLRINHDGSFWADEANAMGRPRLEELELCGRSYCGLPRSLHQLKPACLPHLKALRVVSSMETKYKDYEHIFTPFLSRQLVLQYFHWSRGLDMLGTWMDTPSYRKTDATRKRPSQLPAGWQLSLGPLRLDCRLAFLSVVRGESWHSCAGHLGEDVVTLIFQYATSTSVREICINP